MAEIVNLRLARKRKARASKERDAAGNRAAFGRPAGEKAADRAEGAREARRLDAHRRETEPTASARKSEPLSGKHDA